ncbi:mannosyl-oligosaccharide 1,2-alpha-mannosidase [Coprinopsis sp. MPI-PUGE-AT-0042]|nr:mannosyl-oligosaccharide 1,2-alpha-mannosidase [Coprinopsis sp. MPI-PUGE-AT-0042]
MLGSSKWASLLVATLCAVSSVSADPTWDARKAQVKTAFQHSYNGYRAHAYPQDQLLPRSGGGVNKKNAWSLTLVDSLSTLWLMDLKTEFNLAVQMLQGRSFDQSPNDYIPFAETVTRYLGGLLSAHALSGDASLLTLAENLATVLLPAFNTPSGLPFAGVNPTTGATQQGSLTLTEIATHQVEFSYLSRAASNPVYAQKAGVVRYLGSARGPVLNDFEQEQDVMSVVYDASKYRDLFDDSWNPVTGQSFTRNYYTVAKNVDGAYDYLLKQFLMNGDASAVEQYIKSADSIIENMLYLSPTRGLLYVTDLFLLSTGLSPTRRLEHRACSLAGTLALGAHLLPTKLSPAQISTLFPPAKQELHRWAAEGLGYTCYAVNADQASGLAADVVTFATGGQRWSEALQTWREGGAQPATPPGLREPTIQKQAGSRDYTNLFPGQWALRPETVESLYILYKTTQNSAWRDRGWAIFQSIEQYTKTTHGYSSVYGIDNATPSLEDDQPSYFLSETLKYLYLLFDDSNSIDLSSWVFTTGGHPLPTN